MDNGDSYLSGGMHVDVAFSKASLSPADPSTQNYCLMPRISEYVSLRKLEKTTLSIKSSSELESASQHPDRSTSSAGLGTLYTCSPIQWEAPGQPKNLSSRSKKSSPIPDNAARSPMLANSHPEQPSRYLRPASSIHSPPPTVAGRTSGEVKSTKITNSAKTKQNLLYQQQKQNLDELESWMHKERAKSVENEKLIGHLMHQIVQLSNTIGEKDRCVKKMTAQLKQATIRAAEDRKTIENLRTQRSAYKKEVEKEEISKRFVTLKAMYGELSDEFKKTKTENLLLKSENARLRPFERANVDEYVVFGDVEDGANEGGDTDEELYAKEKQSGAESSDWETEMA